MLDFFRVRSKELSLDELCAGLTVADLHNLTDEMVNTILDLIAKANDEDVVFVPQDPEAHDEYASDASMENLAWTLGHVIVHVTASSEEGAARSSTLARGAAITGPSRYEVPWGSVITINQCRHRLDESRRMRHAFLNTWPDAPRLDNTYTADYSGAKPRNAVTLFVAALAHEESHLEQIQDILEQARAVQTQD